MIAHFLIYVKFSGFLEIQISMLFKNVDLKNFFFV